MTSQRKGRQLAIHVAGALHVDEVATVQGAYIPQASNQVEWQRSVGGVGSNAARAVRNVLRDIESGTLCLHAAVGVDHAAQQLIAAMESQGVDIAAQKNVGSPTGRYSAVISETGELLLGLADVQLAEQLQAAPIISVLQHDGFDGLLLDANLSSDCLCALAAATAKLPTWLAAMTVSPSKAIKLLPIARQIPLLFCNRREATAMAIESGLIRDAGSRYQPTLPLLLDALVEMGFNDCVLTDGGEPLIVRYQGTNSMLAIPSATMVQNVNGAGDALAGASFAAMVSGCSLPEAVECYGLAQAVSVLGGKSLLALELDDTSNTP